MLSHFNNHLSSSEESYLGECLNICPLNMSDIDDVNKVTNNIEATLLFFRLNFNHKYSRIYKNGKKYVTNIKNTIGNLSRIGQRKCSKLIQGLSDVDLIEKRVHSFYGSRSTFVSLNSNKHGFHIKNFDVLIDKIGSIKEAIIFSKIAYHFSSTRIYKKGHYWCSLSVDEISSWSTYSKNSVRKAIASLVDKGFINKQLFLFKNKLQGHFRIETVLIRALRSMMYTDMNIKECTVTKKFTQNEYTKLSTENNELFTFSTPKSDIPIRIRTKSFINNILSNYSCSHDEHKEGVDSNKLNSSNFEFVVDGLSKKQRCYVMKCIRTLEDEGNIAARRPKQLAEEIIFSIEAQARGIEKRSFKHALFSILKIIRSKNWKVPFGFCKYSTYGQKVEQSINDRERIWNEDKKREIDMAMGNGILQKLGLSRNREGSVHMDVSNESRPRSAVLSDITREAFSIANEIVRIKSSPVFSDEHKKTLIESFKNSLRALFVKGADKDLICNYLRSKK